MARMFEDGEKRCIILFGAPGSGKGTQARMLLNRVHISTGLLLRRRGYDLSTAKLVSDEVVNQLVVEAIESVPYDVILDGYPRTAAQAEFIRDYLCANHIDTIVIELAVRDDDMLVGRLLRRNEGRPDDVESVIRERLEIYKRDTKPALNVLWPTFELWIVDASLHEEYVHKAITRCLEGRPYLEYCPACYGDDIAKEVCAHVCDHRKVREKK